MPLRCLHAPLLASNAARAEPLALHLETGRARLAGHFLELEDHLYGLTYAGCCKECPLWMESRHWGGFPFRSGNGTSPLWAFPTSRPRFGKVGAGPDDYRPRRSYLLAPHDPDYLYEAIVNYAKAPVVDWPLIVSLVTYPDDATVAAGAIVAGGLHRCPLPDFWEQVEEVAAGVEWDDDGAARTQALLALGGCS